MNTNEGPKMPATTSLLVSAVRTGNNRVLRSSAVIIVGLLLGTGTGIGVAVSHKSPFVPETLEYVNIDQLPTSIGRSTLVEAGHSKWTLVEFIDYECPVCRAADEFVGVSVKMPSVRCSRVVVQFPLPIHPQALYAAAAMIAARDLGIDAKLHKLLLTSKANNFKAVLEAQAKDNKIYSQLLTNLADGRYLKLAKKCQQECIASSIPGTPQFCVLTPNGHYLNFKGAQEALDFIRRSNEQVSFPWSP